LNRTNLNNSIIGITGKGEVIKGWDEGVVQMSLGEKAILHISSDYGYGKEGAGDAIPPDADLDFEVELLQIGDQKADIPSESSCCLIL
jgi:FK506-binding protein 1